ncbi:peptidase S9 [Pseudothermotoga hypogea DSM 11164 = NBRC 106472]|uniref:Peptidase S9 n=3 Tax=Pseudothermotoga TaxID=1643951 RepID=A0A0X1KPQ3_9THEM|nr:S9 family peptidase [Pseudothermotoga hypogea]AJC73200.1 peptidase S9 [Pseudothermotoga hypogea DSM 11164 = NBRC 106472]
MWSVSSFAKLVVPTEVRMSPDGTWVAYTIKRIDPEKNRAIRQLILYNLKTRERFFLSEDTSKPRFSPTSKKLAYLKKEDDKSSLCIMELSNFSSYTLLTTPNVSFFGWSHDERNLFVVTQKKRNDPDLYFETRIPVWFDAKGFLDDQRDVFHIFDVESRQELTQFEEKNVAYAFWSKEGIVYTVFREEAPFTRFDIFLHSNGSKRTVLEDVGFIATSESQWGFILLGREKKNAFQHDYVYLLKNGQILPLTERYGLDNSGHISLEVWASDSEGYPIAVGEWVYFKSGERGIVKLERMNLRSFAKETLFSEGAVSCFDASEDGKVAYVAVDDERGAEVCILHDGKNERITSLNEQFLATVTVKRLNHFEYASFDGTKIDAWYLKPDSSPAPLIVFVHGGPKGAYGRCLYFMGQLLAQEGFYVLYTNPRGSDNYDEGFALAVKERTGLEDFKDILSGVEELKRREAVTDIGITGISYGGFMTNWAITQTDMFRAAVSENGISYWFTSYAFSDIGFWFDKSLIGDDPLTNENYRKLSPLFHAKNVKTPLLLIHSLEDYRCPLDQSLMFYHVLKDLGKEVYIAIFKKGAHGHSVQASYSHRLKRYKLIVEFFKQKLLLKSEIFDPEKCFKLD